MAAASTWLRAQRPVGSQEHATCVSSTHDELHPRAQTAALTVQATCPGSQTPQPHQYGRQRHAPSGARTPASRSVAFESTALASWTPPPSPESGGAADVPASAAGPWAPSPAATPSPAAAASSAAASLPALLVVVLVPQRTLAASTSIGTKGVQNCAYRRLVPTFVRELPAPTDAMPRQSLAAFDAMRVSVLDRRWESSRSAVRTDQRDPRTEGHRRVAERPGGRRAEAERPDEGAGRRRTP